MKTEELILIPLTAGLDLRARARVGPNERDDPADGGVWNS